MSLWVIGILIMLAAPAPTQVTEEMQFEYNELVCGARR